MRAGFRAVFGVLALVAPIALAGCPGSNEGTPDLIKIVSSLPRTGTANAQTTTICNGIKMAIDEANGKVGNFRIAYEDWDDASVQRGDWDPAVEAANADRAVKDPDVMVYVGTYNSGAAKISMPVLNKAGVAMVTPANTYPGLTKPGTGEANEPMVYRPSGKVTYFRVVPADDLQGMAAANWAKKMGMKSVFVLHDRGVYGKGIADIFKVHAEKIGLQVKGYDGIDAKASNYKSLASRVQGEGVDLTYFGGTTQSNAGQLIKDLRAGGFQGKVMVPDGCLENALIKAAGAENMEGMVFGTFGGKPPSHLTGRGAEFYKKYMEKYGTEPEVYAVYGYECGRVALEAIRRAGKKDRAAILAEIAATKDFEGALGKWSFDANGDSSLNTMTGFEVKGGKWEYKEYLEATP
jgi:branched-chain amino acid transport system substrate-binding protein